MLRFLTCALFLIAAAFAQQQPSTPEVRINVLEVCRPSEEAQRVLDNALGRLPVRPAFDEDFEVSRGRTTLPGAASADVGGWPLPRYTRKRPCCLRLQSSVTTLPLAAGSAGARFVSAPIRVGGGVEAHDLGRRRLAQ